jgi:hypothetical protein
MVKELKSHLEKIKKFDNDRILWLRLSGFVAIAILVIIFDLTFFKVEGVHWILISIGLILSVCWWYWTMKIIRELLSHRLAEVEILHNIVLDIREIKEDVKKLDQSS